MSFINSVPKLQISEHLLFEAVLVPPSKVKWGKELKWQLYLMILSYKAISIPQLCDEPNSTQIMPLEPIGIILNSATDDTKWHQMTNDVYKISKLWICSRVIESMAYWNTEILEYSDFGILRYWNIKIIWEKAILRYLNNKIIWEKAILG